VIERDIPMYVIGGVQSCSCQQIESRQSYVLLCLNLVEVDEVVDGATISNKTNDWNLK